MHTSYLFLWMPVLAILASSGLLAYIITHVTTHNDMPKGELRTAQNKEEGTVTLTEDRYAELLKAELMLEALQQSGVDNWDGYGEAQDLFHEWQKDDNTQTVPE